MQFDLGDMILDDRARQLRRGSEDIRLSPKAFDFLTLLIKERPRVVTKAELHQRIWAGVFVSDASIAMVVSEVRAALGESARVQSRIRTAHGRGYAFQGDVTIVGAGTPVTSQWLVIGERIATLRDGDNVIGREPGVHVWIDGATVSRHHACVRVITGHVTVEDLGSKNGTFARGAAVRGAVQIADGDEVQFGSVVCVFRQSADPTAPVEIKQTS